jgi:Tol biopolymer transport system component
VPNVNTAKSDFDPSISPDGLTLYMASNRTGSWYIYAASRATPYGTFGTPVLLRALMSSATDAGPCVRRDELEIFFYSKRTGGTGDNDIWRATRSTRASSFSAPVNVKELNTTAKDSEPSVTGDGLAIYFTSERTGGKGGADIWTASRPSTSKPFGTAKPVTELNSAADERGPHISADGLAIVWSSARSGGAGGTDLYFASRSARSAPFSNGYRITTVSSKSADVTPSLSAHKDQLFFCSNRGTSSSNYEIYSARLSGLASDGIAGPGKTSSLLFSLPASSG